MSYKDHPPLVEVGNTVPGYDRSKSDPLNLMAVNMEVNDNQCYNRWTKQGILLPLYVRSQFRICAQSFINLTHFPEKIVTIRSTASAQSIGSGQGFVKCSCKTKCNNSK